MVATDDDGRVTRVGDIARVELGSQDTREHAREAGDPSCPDQHQGQRARDQEAADGRRDRGEVVHSVARLRQRNASRY